MKKSIANKIESLLAKMTSSESVSSEMKTGIKNQEKKTKKTLRQFCYTFPVTLFNLIRPAQQFDFKHDV